MEWSSQLCPYKQNTQYQFDRGWVGLRASLDILDKYNLFSFLRFKPKTVQLAAWLLSRPHSTCPYFQPVLSPKLSEHLTTIRCKHQKMPLIWTAAIKPGYLYKVYLGFAWSIVEFWECHERYNIIPDVAVWQTVTMATNDRLVTVCSS